jgi:urea transport system ATP-binding protein
VGEDDNERWLFRHLDLEIKSAQCTGVVGRNGVGKTTTLKTIMGLLKPKAGRVLLDNVDISNETPDRRVRRGLAYVPQGREILPHLTVRENLRLGFWARAAAEDRPSEKSAFDEVFRLFPKLPVLLERPGGVLSGGEQQQLAIARALLSNPAVLLLDEPTEGIQPSIIDQIEEVILSLKAQRRFAILLVEQGIQFAARLADVYVIMAKGTVVATGNTSELSAEQVKQHLVV